MIPEARLPRYLAMSKIFAQHYLERLLGQKYPEAIDKVEGLLSMYEKQSLYRLARTLPENAAILEIGSYKGASTNCFAAASKLSVQIHSVDTFMAENVAGQIGADTLSEFQKNTQSFENRVHIHRGFSHEIVAQTPQNIDLLFVDGDHSYEGVITDLYHYLPRLCPEAILVMHDSKHPPIKKIIQDFILPIETKRLVALPNMYAGLIQPRKFDFARVKKQGVKNPRMD
jgi:predicted O-methyltransferase YrrM